MTSTLPVPAPGPPAFAGPAGGVLARLVAAWLLAAGSAHTRRAYQLDLSQWAGWLASCDVALFSAARGHVDAWSEQLQREGLAPATIARKIAAVSSFYAYAVDEGAAGRNPAARARRPAIDPDHSDTEALDLAEARTLISAAEADPNPRSAAIVRLALEAGLRESELAAARIEDLGAERGHRTITVTRKGGRRQRLALPPATAHAVDLATGGRTSGPVIATATGRPMAASEIYRTVVRLARRAGITKKITPHTLRHAYATIARDAGAALEDVQDDLGHRDPRTTRRYDRSRYRLDRSAAYKVAAALGA
ncbi:MAG TPA: tyrosine-type recombinase/integrase [Streptosporangiaceae bacterium]